MAVRAYHKPLVVLIWLGAVVMFFGGALSLSDRRLARRRADAGAQAGAAAGGVRLGRCDCCLCSSSPCPLHGQHRRLAVQPDEVLANPKLEARARALSQELRCMVCQNESIDNSDAPLAHDLRVLVRQRIKAGDSDQQVLDFLVARYGEFVLLKPPFNWHTALLWLLTPLVLLGRGWVLCRRCGGSGRLPQAMQPLCRRTAERGRTSGV